jgi:integrase
VAATLLAIAGEWVEAPQKQMAQLKELRSKLGGGGQRRFTEKNRALTLRFEDPRLTRRLMDLPDKLWRAARRTLPTRKLAFVELQTSLAIDIDLHVPMRIRNLAALRFDEHIHWPQGRGKPALLIVAAEETKNENPLEFELPKYLSDRLYAFRHEIAPPVIGKVPDALFISRAGVPRGRSTLRVAMQKALRTHIGVRMSPHQFRHLAAKFALDENPAAYEHVSQLLAHKDRNTAPRFYTGMNTRRAGRAHAALIRKFRESKLGRPQRSPKQDKE